MVDNIYYISWIKITSYIVYEDIDSMVLFGALV